MALLKILKKNHEERFSKLRQQLFYLSYRFLSLLIIGIITYSYNNCYIHFDFLSFILLLSNSYFSH